MIAEYAPGRTGASSAPADLAEVACADPDLLAREFDALMAANYPHVADRPDPRPPRRPARLLTRRLPPPRPSLPVRRCRSQTSRRASNAPGPGSADRPRPHRPADRAQEVMP
jgi:hypothetical protein